VRHMSLLLDDLLDISRVTRGTLVLRVQPADLRSMIDAAVETARPAIEGKRHTLTIELPDEPVRFSADPLRMAQILSNLLTNAAKYTDPEGHIRLTACCDRDEIIIRVSDTGIGMSSEALPRIFEMFSQIGSARDRSEGGLGIGLALTKGLVELHGGTIHAHSPGLGRGSEFVVRLPGKLAPDTADSPGVQSACPVVSRRVLIADDNRDAADTLAEFLRMQGHEVELAHDGPAAVVAFAEFRPHVVLLDIGMPGLSGYEVARKMRELEPQSDVTLIAITGWGQESDKQQAVQAGFDYHLTKPCDLQRVSQLIQPGWGAADPALRK